MYQGLFSARSEMWFSAVPPHMIIKHTKSLDSKMAESFCHTYGVLNNWGMADKIRPAALEWVFPFITCAINIQETIPITVKLR